MGVTYAEIGIENVINKRRIETLALVDSGSVFFTVPAHIATQLGFDIAEVATREVVLADGSRKAVPMIGPVRVFFANRHCDLSALVLGDEPLLGAVPMEMMDVLLHPGTQSLVVNPDNPFIPVAITKRSELSQS
jgi:clan AA aspartic protease